MKLNGDNVKTKQELHKEIIDFATVIHEDNFPITMKGIVAVFNLDEHRRKKTAKRKTKVKKILLFSFQEVLEDIDMERFSSNNEAISYIQNTLIEFIKKSCSIENITECNNLTNDEYNFIWNNLEESTVYVEEDEGLYVNLYCTIAPEEQMETDGEVASRIRETVHRLIKKEEYKSNKSNKINNILSGLSEKEIEELKSKLK